MVILTGKEIIERAKEIAIPPIKQTENEKINFKEQQITLIVNHPPEEETKEKISEVKNITNDYKHLNI